jgi:hypothetical protein
LRTILGDCPDGLNSAPALQPQLIFWITPAPSASMFMRWAM